MFTVIHNNKFKKIPWKNGKGTTLELAISENGSLSDFDWRLSIATVSKNGAFSDFSGYSRNLILIDGKGIALHHNKNQVDRLEKILQFSTFNGADKTTASLFDGPITDFNVMTKTLCLSNVVETFSGFNQVTLRVSDIAFIYGLKHSLRISSSHFKSEQQL